MDKQKGKLQFGKVTQNEYWISYKTTTYCRELSFINGLKEELSKYLEANQVNHGRNFCVETAYESITRLRCVTLMVEVVDITSNQLEYEDDAIN